MHKSSAAVWEKLRRVSDGLMKNGYQKVAVLSHPEADAIIFAIYLNDFNMRAAMLPTWKILQMDEADIVRVVNEQILDKWKRR